MNADGRRLDTDGGIIMPMISHRYIVDNDGEKVSVVLDIKEYEQVLADLEELESIRAYDRAKASGDEAIDFDQAIEEIERSRKDISV